jgi:Zn-dependent protease with chaperone function
MKPVLFFFICFQAVFGQKYIPIDTADRPKREEFVKIYESSNNDFAQILKSKYDGKLKKELLKTYEEFVKDFSKEIKEGQFSFDQRFLKKANEILDEIKAKNSQVPQNLKILVSKNPSLNAFCLPDGTFSLNMGLFYWLNNEDQVAGIICHEIGHKILEHSIKTQIKVIEDATSDNTKNAIRSIKKEKYNKSQKALELVKSKLYATGEVRRKHEFQADSVACQLLKNTKYNKFDFIEALKLSEKYDTLKPKGLKIDIYKQIFDLPNQKFKEDWLKKEDFSAYDYKLYQEKINKDSIASHPETEDRIKKLESLFPELKNSTTVKPDPSFIELEKIADNEQVPNMYFSEDYGSGIYLCLVKIQANKNLSYNKEWLGKCFTKIYDARKKYNLNRYLDRIDAKNHSESYQQFLSFMWNLNLDEIKNIADYYSQKLE